MSYRWTFVRSRVADPQWRAGVNRIMGHPIGVYVIAGRWQYGVCRPIRSEDRRRKQADKLR